MYLLCEIRDNTPIERVTFQTLVDIDLFEDIDQAIIYLEPNNCNPKELGSFFIIDDDGKFYQIVLDSKGWADPLEFRSDPIMALKMLVQHVYASRK